MPTIPYVIQNSKFFHLRSKNPAYVKALEENLPNSCAFLKYSFKSSILESDCMILVIKQGSKIFEEKISVKNTDGKLKVITADNCKFKTLKECLDYKRKEWQKKYKTNLNFVFNFELARDQEVENKVDVNLTKLAEANLNNFLKDSPEKINDIFKLPKQLPPSNYTIQAFYSSYYLVSSALGYFVISYTELQQLINLTEKEEKKVTFSQKTPSPIPSPISIPSPIQISNPILSPSPNFFALKTNDELKEVDADKYLYQLSLEADSLSQEKVTHEQSLDSSSKAAPVKQQLRLYYEDDSPELAPEPTFTQMP